MPSNVPIYLRTPPIGFFAIELVYSAIVVFLCLLIYFKTKEIYDLSKYKGIYHFRNAFLFLSLAYLVRFFIASLAFSIQLFDSRIEVSPNEWLMVRSLILFISYFSFMAIFSLACSLLWRKLESGILQHDVVLHAIALGLSSFIFLTRSYCLFILFHIASLPILILTAVINYRSSEKRGPFISQIYIIYFLLFAFWVVNIAFLPLRGLQIELRIPFYAASVLIMSLIAYRVVKIVS
ncbi:MAG: hypothetical protein H0Z28_07400 [Archaeoglobus sp.]|nr:hypothetical protein [Archaeoglobus sp.]